ncbi:MAG: hypothetical protein IPI77_19600 [Saprospiraceae bacterium]|nr:hypothetical protein [Saprospiraceae bacterium]
MNFIKSKRRERLILWHFGKSLLHAVVENDEEYAAIIKPTLRNWEAERVAVVDMILLKMANARISQF